MPSVPSLEQYVADLREDARSSLRLGETLDNAARLPLMKDFLTRHTAALRQWHAQGMDSRAVSHYRARTMDVLNISLYELALRQAGLEGAPVKAALIATGGYGREELSPHSDMDFMLLFDETIPPDVLENLQEAFTDRMLYPLWDLNLKVGHSMRTIDQAIEEAHKDNFTKNALLEARLVYGDSILFERFEKTFADDCAMDPKGYLRERLDGGYERRKRYGNTVFLQEPEIKNGTGGLRDYQNLLWIGKVVLGARGIGELARKGYLSVEEANELENAHAFLLRVRNEVHFQSARPTDLLDLERQGVVALALGYGEPNLLRRIEIFMRDYYASAHTIYRLARLVEQRLERDYFPRPEANEEGLRVDGFRIAGGFVFAESPDVFKEDPGRLIRVFRHAQQHKASFDFSLEVLVRERAGLATADIALSPQTQGCLRQILEDVGNVAETLGRMHGLGMLVKFLPEFEHLTCLVQHEHYHRYTVDIHTLATIARLDMVFNGEDPEAAVYLPQLRHLETPWVLYAALLMHDAGKADGIKGHSQVGVKIAGPVFDRLGLSSAQKNLALFVIAHHMEMSRVCQRYDVEDPRTASVFARTVENAQNLRALFVHTYCDANGTSATLWNAYKQALHVQLFNATLARIEGDGASPARVLAEAKSRLWETLARTQAEDDLPDDEVSAHFAMMPDGYFLNATPEEVRCHLMMAHELFESLRAEDGVQTLTPVIQWSHDEASGLSSLDVVTWDRTGLFYRLAGALAAAGINILSTRAFSREDDITIDTFAVEEAHGGPVKSPHTRARFEKAMARTLIDGADLMPEIEAQAEKISRTFFSREKSLKAKVATQVQAYREEALGKNVVEVRANDRIGLLHRIAKAISEAGFDISFARIATERGVALDTFYVAPSLSDGDASQSALDGLRAHIERALQNA